MVDQIQIINQTIRIRTRLTVSKQPQDITHFVIAGYLFVETVTVLF